jgi:hypothetical protein
MSGKSLFDNLSFFCPPSGKRVYIVIFFSILFTCLLTTVSVFNGKNRNEKLEDNSPFRYSDKNGKEINEEVYGTGIGMSVISGIFMLYLLRNYYNGETWDFGEENVLFDYVFSGNTDINPSMYKEFEEGPCLGRSYKTCEPKFIKDPFGYPAKDAYGNNIKINKKGKDCKWDGDECRYEYPGGYGNFILFVAFSIYLIYFGSIIQKDRDPDETSSEFDKLSIASIILGALGLLYSLVDLVIC